MEKNNFYISQQIKIYSSFEEGKEELKKYGDRFLYLSWLDKPLMDCDVLKQASRIFVIAEPGYGKTEFLKKNVQEALESGSQSLYLDLKQLGERSVEDAIKDADNQIQLKNTSNVLIALDALDEVKTQNVFRTIEEIKKFTKAYDKIQILISCRRHYFDRYDHLFKETDLKYVHLLGFQMNQVEEYLSLHKMSGETIEKLIKLLQMPGRDIILKTPRYLSFLPRYVNKKGIGGLVDITRAKLFDFFVIETLRDQDEKKGADKAEMAKRILAKLALVMEIYQTNTITKDELMIFLDDAESDLKNAYLATNPIESLWQDSIIKDVNNELMFYNSEFQEYLAAQEMARLGDADQIMYDLVIDTDLKEIFPSWFSTLAFAIDLNPNYIGVLLKFILRNQDDRILDESYHRILTSTDPKGLSNAKKEEIFYAVFNFYQNRKHWIETSVSNNLSQYVTPKIIIELRKRIDKIKLLPVDSASRYVPLTNITRLVESLVMLNKLSGADITFWKKNLVTFVLDKNTNGVLQRGALMALSEFGDQSVITKVKEVWPSKDEAILNNFIHLCVKLAPVDAKSIDYFIDGAKRGLIPAQLALLQINDPGNVKKLLNKLMLDEEFAHRFFEHFHGEDENKIVDNIQLALETDPSILSVIDKFIIWFLDSSRHYQIRQSSILEKILSLRTQRDSNTLVWFVDKIMADANLSNALWSFRGLFTSLLSPKNINDFVDMLSATQDTKEIAFYSFLQLNQSDSRADKDTYKAGKKLFGPELKLLKKQKKAQSNLIDPDQEIYKLFQLKLEPALNQYSGDLFDYYMQHKDTVNQYISSDEKVKLKRKTNKVLDVFDPSKHKITLGSSRGGGTTFSMPQFAKIFGDALKVAKALSISITQKQKSNLVNFIPFADYEEVSDLLTLVGRLSHPEVKKLITVYKKRSGDTWRFAPDGFIRCMETNKTIEAVSALRDLAQENRIEDYHRVSALRVATRIKPELKILKDIFKKENKTNGNKRLAEAANCLLIELKDQSAIAWRFKEIKKRAAKFERQKGFHSIGSLENELDDKKFAEPLSLLSDTKYESLFYDLLDYSFSLIQKDKQGFYPYANYIWRIVCDYIRSLKISKSYKPLKSLELYLAKHYNLPGMNWFGYQVKGLKEEFLRELGKPTNISQCIQKYNTLKNTAHLPIRSEESLFNTIVDILENELFNWLSSDGIKILQDQKEPNIQKMISMEMEVCLLRRGFRKNELRPLESGELAIIREPQLKNDKRVDFEIYYGFIGPLILELKLTRNTDLASPRATTMRRKPSHKSMINYMKGYRANHGIFLVINNKLEDDYNWEKHMAIIKEAYSSIPNVDVIGLNPF